MILFRDVGTHDYMTVHPKFVCFFLIVAIKDRCKLYCRVAGTTNFYQLKDRVADGTPCGTETNDICVQGLCRVSQLIMVKATFRRLLSSAASEYILVSSNTAAFGDSHTLCRSIIRGLGLLGDLPSRVTHEAFR